jgi:CheY-like chemotaxis protein
MERRRILIVENEPILRQWLVRYLRKKGWEVDEAANGQQAFGQIQVSAMQIILTDMLMPASSGFDLIRALKKNPLLRQIPVAIMTGSPSGLLQDLLTEYPELKILYKPFGLDELERELDLMWAKRLSFQQAQTAQ